jgi:hypothetical protein
MGCERPNALQRNGWGPQAPARSPVVLILQATERIAEAMELLQAAMHTVATSKTPELDFGFLDTRLADVDWGLDYERKIHKIITHWNKVQLMHLEAERRVLTTVRDLLRVSSTELLCEPNVGPQTITRIQAILGKHGAALPEVAD